MLSLRVPRLFPRLALLAVLLGLLPSTVLLAVLVRDRFPEDSVY